MTHWARDEETAEKIPDGEEEGGDHHGKLLIGSDCNGHHSVACEVEESEEHEEEVPESGGRREERDEAGQDVNLLNTQPAEV